MTTSLHPRPPWLPPAVFPFAIKGIDDGPDRVSYVDAGDGPTVLLVHAGLWSFVWRDVVAALQAEHRCIAIDAPATGGSGGHPRRDATIRAAAARLGRLVHHLDLHDIHLVAHDLGGPAAVLSAGAWPGRVRSLTAVNTFAWRPSGPLFRGMLAVMGSAPVRELDALTGVVPRMTASRFGVGRHLDRPSRRAFRAGVNRRSFHHYLRDARRTDAWPEVEAALDRLADRPLTTVFGERNDPLRFQPVWRARFPHARQVVVPRGNHFPMCDAPDLVAGHIRAIVQDAGRGGPDRRPPAQPAVPSATRRSSVSSGLSDSTRASQ